MAMKSDNVVVRTIINLGIEGFHSVIRYFLMLVATGSFSPERGLPLIFCVDFNHFKSIIMSALLHRKL